MTSVAHGPAGSSVATPVTVYVVDDRAIARDELEATFGEVRGFLVAGSADAVRDALRRLTESADGAVIDLRSINGHGLATVRAEIDDRVEPLVIAPIGGFDASMWASVVHGGSVPCAPPFDDVEVVLSVLTPQERRVIDLVAEGFTNREIADRLDLAEKTVRNYVSNVLGKLKMHNRTQVAAFIARGLGARAAGTAPDGDASR